MQGIFSIQHLLCYLPSKWGLKRVRMAHGSWLMALGSLFLTPSCEDTVYRSSVPTYPVEMRLNIAGEYVHFVPDNPGVILTFTKPRFPNEAVGFAGLLICTGLDRQYYAYDLACPKCLSQKQPLEVDGMFATCPRCGEQFEYLGGIGIPQKGIVHEYLRKYQTTISGNYLHIHH